MDWTALIGPAVVAAVISGLVSAIGIWISARTARGIHAEKLSFDAEQAAKRSEAELALAERKIDADIALAEKKFALDRGLAAWRRRTEFAEEVLGDFYRARDIIQAARSPGGFSEEGGTRQKESWEKEEDTRLLNSYYRTIERLDREIDFFSQLIARRYRFIALFGHEAANPYSDLWRIRGEIIVAVRMLLQTHQNRELGSLPENRKAWETTMGWVHTESDPIEARLDQIIDEIERTCRPVIEDMAG